MTTRKKMRSKRRHRHKRHTNKMLKNKEKKEKKHGSFRRRHRRRHHKTTVSSWDKHYTYESNVVNSEVSSKSDHNKDNDVQAIHGLKDFLQGKKINL